MAWGFFVRTHTLISFLALAGHSQLDELGYTAVSRKLARANCTLPGPSAEAGLGT